MAQEKRWRISYWTRSNRMRRRVVIESTESLAVWKFKSRFENQYGYVPQVVQVERWDE